MPITVPEPVAKRGDKDARRHREKQRDAIKKNIPKIIAEESIITNRRGRVVKVPIRSIDIPRFRSGNRRSGQGQGQGGGGIGQGSGKPGDIIGRRPGKGQQPGPGAGEEPGVDYLESEIDIEEIIEMMLEDLGLPNLQQKEKAELEVMLGFKIRGIQRSGPRILLDPRRSTRDSFGRFWSFLDLLQDETGKDEQTCYLALKQSDGNLDEALKLLEDPGFTTVEEVEIEPFPIVHEKDLRFHKVRENITHESNAVVIAMMDVSGSMFEMKKYLARSMLFWIVEFLRTIYNTVEVRFIIHHSTARLVPEEEFFHTMESGGTNCYTAYELASSLIESEYPTSHWNVYAMHFSDGDDFNPKRTGEEAQKLIEKGINMFGYGEIRVGEHYRSYSNVLPAFEERFPLSQHTEDGINVISGDDNFPFLGVIIQKKEDIWPAIKQFLKKDRWTE